MTGPMDFDNQAQARLAALLEAYGADPGRWPAADRAAHAHALADPALGPLVKDARALDMLLERASAPSPRAGAISALLAEVAADRGENVVSLGEARRRATRRPLSSLPALSALAASLAIGLYLGASGVTANLPGLASQAGENAEVAQIEELDVLDGTVGFLAEGEGT